MSFGKVSNIIQRRMYRKRKLSEINYGHDLESDFSGDIAICKKCSIKIYFYYSTNEWVQINKEGPTIFNKGKKIPSCSEYKMSEALE